MAKQKVQPLLLTSQYARGVRGADSAAEDEFGRDWYLASPLDAFDEDVPVWQKCVVCGTEVDELSYSHWYQADGLIEAHEECVELVYPTLEMARLKDRALEMEVRLREDGLTLIKPGQES